MIEPFWLSQIHVQSIHDEQLIEHGGHAGILSPEGLDSALARPVNYYLYEKPDLADLAACYAHGIVKNHPFHDGNKRAAFVVTAVFLDLNGVELTMSEADATLMVIGLAEGPITQEQCAALLRESSRKATKAR